MLAFLSGCGMFGRRQEKAKIEVKDVPAVARGEDEAPRHRILVLPFLDERFDKSKAVEDVARQTVVRELSRTQQFVIVSLDDFPQDPKKFITEEGDYDLAQVAKIASGMGALAVTELSKGAHHCMTVMKGYDLAMVPFPDANKMTRSLNDQRLLLLSEILAT